MGTTPDEYELTLKNSVKIRASPPKNSIFFYSTPEEGGRGVADIKCNNL